MRPIRTGALIVAAFVLIVPSAVFPIDMYTFESLPINTFIDGYDNWVDQPGQGQAYVGLDEGSVNGTKVVRHLQTVWFQEPAYITRVNDAAFSFQPFLSGQGEAIIQYDFTGEFATSFALGTDLNGDGMLKSTDGEIGPAFGSWDRAFRVEEANRGATYDAGFNEGGRTGNAVRDWYQVQLRIDFSSNDGDGSGSLYFRNLTDGDVSFELVHELADVNLRLSNMNPDADLETWNTMWIHIMSGGDMPSADNLIPNVQPIVDVVSASSIDTAALHTNSPNPFNPSTTILYELAAPSEVTLAIFDISGRLVRQLVSGADTGAGIYSVTWHGRDDLGRTVGSGVYLYRLETETFSQTRRMILSK